MPRRRAGRAAPEQGGDGTADNGTERVHGGYLGVLGDACAHIFLEGKPRSTVGWGLPGPIDSGSGLLRSGHSLYSPNDAEGEFCELRIDGVLRSSARPRSATNRVVLCHSAGVRARWLPHGDGKAVPKTYSGDLYDQGREGRLVVVAGGAPPRTRL